jgi:adenine-specific DNA-methyltransferase
MNQERRKRLGAYFTPDAAAAALVKWATRSSRDRLLDPSAGDGSFISRHRRSVGVETDPASAEQARKRAPWALVHEGDFFSWASSTKERFDCAAGNPPFIRYQRFGGDVRARAQELSARNSHRYPRLGPLFSSQRRRCSSQAGGWRSLFPPKSAMPPTPCHS